MEAHFTNSVADYLKIGATSVTGTNCGVTAVTAYQLGASGISASNANVGWAEFLICNGKPSGAELTALDSYVTSRYGAGLV